MERRIQTPSEDTAHTAKRGRNFILPVIIVIAVVVLMGLMFGFIGSINDSIYSHDENTLKTLTEQSASLVSQEILASADYATVLAGVTEETLTADTDVFAYLNRLSNSLQKQDFVYQLSDSSGIYYSSTGASAKITDSALNAESAPDYQVFFSYSDAGDVECLYHLYRLEKPVPAKAFGKPVMITHFSLGVNAQALTNLYTAGLADEANGFIVDKDGLMIYRDVSGLGLLLPGVNIFTKLEDANVELLHGKTPEDVYAELDDGETSVSDLEITAGDRPGHYYFTITPIAGTDWYAAAILDADSVTLGIADALSQISVFMVSIIVLLGGSAILVVVYITRTKNERINALRHEEEARKAKAESDAKSAFLSNMSHDIRTPMNAINGFTSLAKKNIDDKEKVSQYLDKITSSSEHLLSLINDVLDMSRIESGKTEIVNKPMNIITVADNCLSIIGGQLGGRNLKLSHAYVVEHPQVLGDALHLRQVFINILGNAVKFTPDGGHITLRVFEEKAALAGYSAFRIEFEDDGCGMSEEFQTKIWDAFSQEGGGSRTNYTGTGLGMAITKNLVDLMGGSISVKSELDKGSVFIIEISLPQTDELIENAADVMETNTDSLAGCKVLLVEDNEMNAEIATEILEEKGLVVTHAENGKEAVDMFSGAEPGTFDIILMDIMMPVMNGLEATKTIRALPREDAKSIPIIAMTANAYAEDVERSLEAGMNAHLSKPVNFTALIKELKKFNKK
ncbi:MAG TPA: response regulator [Methanocorpusculum sp.]|nr:response regulator [Methanocorpusculum sp.]